MKSKKISFYIHILAIIIISHLGNFSLSYADTSPYERNVEVIKKDFFLFSFRFFNWLENILIRVEKDEKNGGLDYDLSLDPKKRIHSSDKIFRMIKEDDQIKLRGLLNSHRNTLKMAKRRMAEVVKFEDYELLPKAVMENLITLLSQNNYDDQVFSTNYTKDHYYTDLIQFIIGGEYNVKICQKRVISVNGQRSVHQLMNRQTFKRISRGEIPYFLKFVQDFDMNTWDPIDLFLGTYHQTRLNDDNMNRGLGKQLEPFFKHYFQFLDIIGRVRMFKLLASDYEFLMKKKKEYEEYEQSEKDPHEEAKNFEEYDQLAIRIFISSGPVLIKFLQQLREQFKESQSKNKIAALLIELDKGRPMSPREVKIKKEYFYNVLYDYASKSYDLNGISFDFKAEDKAHIASIGEIRRLHVIDKSNDENNIFYFLKMQRDGVTDTFQREKRLIIKMFKDYNAIKDFDKGLEKTLSNMVSGIERELSFQHERTNIENCRIAYEEQHLHDDYFRFNTPGIQIKSVAIPDIYTQIPKNELATKTYLLMETAQGVPVAKILKGITDDTAKTAYMALGDFYRLYLYTALKKGDGTWINFFHGDTHRDNLFIDLENKVVTAIDLGNAGILNEQERVGIKELLNKVAKIKGKDKKSKVLMKELGQDIYKLAKLQDDYKKELNDFVLKTYFDVCFDPKASSGKLEKASEKLYDQVVNLKYGEVEKEKIPDLIDAQRFAQAILKNALEDENSPIPLALGKKTTTSEKLIEIFDELSLNGVSLPEPVIFFNKSKKLLEGILSNLRDNLNANDRKSLPTIDDFFDNVMKTLESSEK